MIAFVVSQPRTAHDASASAVWRGFAVRHVSSKWRIRAAGGNPLQPSRRIRAGINASNQPRSFTTGDRDPS